MSFQDEIRVIAAYHAGNDLRERLAAAVETQQKQSEALLKAADRLDELERDGSGLKALVSKVIGWAQARKIIPNSTPQAQLLKTMSELGELADATLKNDREGVVDGVGDVLVTLIIYAALQGVTPEECLAAAYEQIKDRTGTLTPEGVFVKDEVAA